MAKPITTAFTDYPSGQVVRRATLLRYDGNLYADVRFEDGTEEQIKRGYLRRDESLLRPIPDVDWHVLAGGTRETFKRRARSTMFQVASSTRVESDDSANTPRSFKSQRRAVAHAAHRAKALNVPFIVRVSVITPRVQFYGSRLIECTPNGDAAVHDARLRRRAAKYLRGFGKRPRLR